FGQVVRKLRKLRWLNKRNAMLGQQIVEHARVLHAHESAEHAEHAGGKSEIQPNAVCMPRSGACAGANDHLVTTKIFNELFDQRKHRHSAPVDDALATDLDYVRLRQYLHGSRPACLRHQAFIVERAGQQRITEFGKEVTLHSCSLALSLVYSFSYWSFAYVTQTVSLRLG